MTEYPIKHFRPLQKAKIKGGETEYYIVSISKNGIAEMSVVNDAETKCYTALSNLEHVYEHNDY